MFIVDGISERTKRGLKILLDSGVDRVYVSRSIASEIGDLQKGRPVLIDLPTRESVTSNERVKIFVRMGSYTTRCSSCGDGLEWLRSDVRGAVVSKC
jgi:hypothetical protein